MAGFGMALPLSNGVNSYHDHTTEEGQIALNAEFKRTMVLKPDGAGGSRASMRKRWLDVGFCSSLRH